MSDASAHDGAAGRSGRTAFPQRRPVFYKEGGESVDAGAMAVCARKVAGPNRPGSKRRNASPTRRPRCRRPSVRDGQRVTMPPPLPTPSARLARRPRALLIDLAGVLHVGDQAIDGAVDALARLRAAGIPLRFLTNTTRTPRRTIVAKLRHMGFDVDEDELQTAPHAAQQLVRERGLKPLYLIHPDLFEEIGPSADDPDAVVMGDMGPFLDYAQLNAAFRLLMAGKPFIAMAKNRYFMEEDGLSLDMGAFVTGLEFSSGAHAEIVGKPAASFFRTALADLGVAPGDAAVIGDDLHDDVGAALAAGIPAILVRTGKFRLGDDADPAVRPSLVADDFADAVDRLLALE